MFKGSIVALVTPFDNGAVDESAFRRLIRYHLDGGTDGILVSGCTGEAANLTIDEVLDMIRWAREEMTGCDRNVTLLAGTGTNSTRTTLERTEAVESSGVDGVLLITPYYNKPTPAGQIAHYAAVARNTRLPVILYNVPGRTGANMLPETVAELGRISNIVALKEAGGNIDQVSQLRLLSDIIILSGDDTLTLPMLSVGAQGVISVTANIDPRRMAGMCREWAAGNYTAAETYHRELFLLSKAMFVESNPMPVKAALAMMGLIRNEFRLPLVPVKPESEPTIREALITAGLLENKL